MVLSPSNVRFNRTSDSQLDTRVCFVCERPVSYGQGTDVPTGVNIAGQTILAHSYCVGTPRTEAEAFSQARAIERVEEALTGEPAFVWPAWCADCGRAYCAA